MDYHKFSDIFDLLYFDLKKDLEFVLMELKREGAGSMLSVVILAKKLNIHISEANKIVLNSEAWKDIKDSSQDFDKKMKEELRRLGGNDDMVNFKL